MTGWRVGSAVGPEMIVKNMVKCQENFIGCINSQAQYAAIEALEDSRDALHRMLCTYSDGRKTIVEGINGIPNLSCVPPKRAFYCFVNIRRSQMSSEEFAMELLKQTRVVTVPGSGFGCAGEGYVRLSYATSQGNIASGLERIQRFMESRRS